MSLSPDSSATLAQLSAHIQKIEDERIVAIDLLTSRFKQLIDDRIRRTVENHVNTRVDSRPSAYDESPRSKDFSSLLKEHTESFQKLYAENKGYIDAYQNRVLPNSIKELIPTYLQRSEPPVLSLSFCGTSCSTFTFFVQVIKDALSGGSFPDDHSRITWISRHFNPIGSASHIWWMKLLRQNASMHNISDPFEALGLPISEFNSLFTSLSSLLSDLPESVLIDNYKKYPNPKILDQVIGHEKRGRHHPLLPSPIPLMPPPPQLRRVQVPRESNAMEIDIHALTADSPLTHKKYKEACHARKLCTKA
ncbi:hypothetical protein CROQUDRAFT_93737 [Cronartium quercuum f. sp. fusiforme G11]|uniref:Uncharacterized protein n=1 Tax=Cronartium quercuum f. sp. fusiforme G11 TaxID=708437 RepID=A0A9P6NJT7_9BASI|nr:hypothetical protein CROQUDRAFT_93737 [Cronartium quercuum f. sp. fusiforme G11]